ncbi:unnamed protein product [Ixodes hexagonus]
MQVRRKKKYRQVRECCVPLCRSKASRWRWRPDFVLHSFPSPTLEFLRDGKLINRRQEWARVLGIKKIQSNMLVCSKHFEPDAYLVSGLADKRGNLKRDAVPTLNLPELPEETGPQKCLHMVWMPPRDDTGVRVPHDGSTSPSIELVSSDISLALAQTRSALKRVMELKESRSSLNSVCRDIKRETAESPSQDECLVAFRTEEICHREPSEESPLREDFITPDCPPHKDDEFVVDENCLLQLFRQCSTCRAPCSVSLVADGNEVMVTAVCPNAHQRSWTNVL